MKAPAAIGAALGLALGVSCATHAGDRCKKDDDCGPGFDCFHEACARVCTKDDDCAARETCFHHRCTARENGAPAGDASPPGAASRGPTSIAPGAATVPPLPDTTAAELRAIRRELELLQEGQQRILEALEHGGAHETARPPPAGSPAPAPHRSPAAPPPRGDRTAAPGAPSPRPLGSP